MRSLQNLCALITLVCAAALPSRVAAQTYTWIGTSSPNWSDAGNWSLNGGPAGAGGAPVSGSTVLFNNLSTGNLTNTNDIAGLNLAVIQVVNPASAVTINGTQTITFGTAGTILNPNLNMSATAVPVTINSPLVLSAPQVWSVLGLATAPTPSPIPLTIGGTISGSAGLTVTTVGISNQEANNGTIFLTNTGSTYNGTIALDRGLFTAGMPGNPGGIPSAAVVAIGGAAGQSNLTINGTSQTIAGVATGPGNTRRLIGNSATLSTLTINVPTGATQSYQGQVGSSADATSAVTNNLAITKTGGGLQEFNNSGASTVSTTRYSGPTTIQAGALGFTNGVFLTGADSMNIASYVVLDGGVISSSGATALSFTRTLSGTSARTNFQWTANGGGFSARGAALTVNITVGATAGAAIDWGTTPGSNLVGTLKFGHESADNRTTFLNGLNLNGAVRTIDVADNTAVATDFAQITGSVADPSTTGGLIKTGAGMLELAPVISNTYGGTTAVNAGILSAIKSAALPGFNSGLVTVQTGATLQVRIGGGTEWTIGEVNTLLGNPTTFGNGAYLGLDVSTGTLDFGTITGLRSDMGLRKAGAGTLLFPNDITLLKPVVLDGTLSNSLSIATNVIMAAGISGGTITKAGTGRLTLQGNSSLTTSAPQFVVNDGELFVDSGAGLTTNGNTAIRVFGNNVGGTATLTVATGGTLSMNTTTGNLRVGSDGQVGSAIVSVAGTFQATAFTTGGKVTFDDEGTTNTLNLQPGGLLVTRQIDRDNSTGGTGTATGILNVNGGTIRAVQTNPTFISFGTTTNSQFNVLNGGVTIDSNGFDVTVSQPLLPATGSAGGLTKIGAGTLTLAGANTYTGPTMVNAGKMTIGATGTLTSTPIIVGTTAGSTAVLDVTAITTGFPVGAGKTLGGHGTVAGPVAFSGGTLSPGATTGILTMTGAVTMNSASTMFVELNGKNTAGIDYDQLNLAGGGTIDLAGANLTGTIGYAPGSGDSITIITGGTVLNQFASAGMFSFGGYTGTIQYNGTSVVLTGFTPVPEPVHVILACGGLTGLTTWWRRRRGQAKCS